ncbi:MAG TPA: hypothetical protein VJ735_20100 [Actinomycetes bacterium]|nr:hypothetical protein [Actinomycetes bacterium]
MSVYTAAFLEEARKGVDRPGQPEIYPIMDVTLPGGARRLAKANINPRTLGPYEPLVMEWGSVRRGVDARNASLQAMEVGPVVSDISSPTLTRRLATEVAIYRRTLRLSPCTIRLYSPNLDEADWHPVFTGVLDSPDMVAPLSWRLHARTDDGWLKNSMVPKASFTPADWPNALPQVFGNFVPIIYGIHDSTGTGTAGMVPAYCVDSSTFTYAVGITGLKAVRAVFSAGSLVSVADYTVEYPTRNGVAYTVIRFDNDQSDAAITCDVDGITDDATPDGELILNPAAQMQHLLVVFGFNDWRSGTLPSVGSTPVHEATFTAAGAFVDAMGHEGSRYLGGQNQVTLREELQTFLENEELRSYWRGDGKLALGFNDHRPTNGIYNGPWLRGTIDRSRARPLRIPMDSQGILREITLQFVHGEVSGKYHQTLRVQDLSVPDITSSALSLPWSAARVL